MNEERWNAVRQFYMESFGIAPELVDLMASNEILLMSVSGASNQSISKLLNIDEDAIGEILTTIFDFPGWEEDLEFSPYQVYQEDSTYLCFVGELRERIDSFSLTAIGIEEIDLMYKNCEVYSQIEERLDKEWS